MNISCNLIHRYREAAVFCERAGERPRRGARATHQGTAATPGKVRSAEVIGHRSTHVTYTFIWPRSPAPKKKDSKHQQHFKAILGIRSLLVVPSDNEGA